MFIVNKLWSIHHNPEHVREILGRSLQAMNLSYVDLYLIHWPVSYGLTENEDQFPTDDEGNPIYMDIDIVETWHAMEELVDAGLTKSIGLSNFNSTQVDIILENARIKPVNNQVEIHAHCLNKKLIKHCKSKDVVVTGYAPLGLCACKFSKYHYRQFDFICSGAPGRDVFSDDERFVILEPIIREIAMKHRRTPAQVLLRYQYQIGTVFIPKSITMDRIITNFDVFDHFHLDETDIADIESISNDYHFRTVRNDHDSLHPFFPFHDNCD